MQCTTSFLAQNLYGVVNGIIDSLVELYISLPLLLLQLSFLNTITLLSNTFSMSGFILFLYYYTFTIISFYIIE